MIIAVSVQIWKFAARNNGGVARSRVLGTIGNYIYCVKKQGNLHAVIKMEETIVSWTSGVALQEGAPNHLKVLW